jgi:hypothetical protein
MRIWPVGEHNIANFVQIAKELHGLGTFGHTGPEFDWDYMMRSTIAAVKSADFYLRIAMADDGEYCGAVCGHVTPFFFSPKLMGMEDGWYVREGTVGRTKIAVTLMRGFVSWCLDARGALLVQTGDIAAIDSLAVDSVYRHMGFKRFGTVYKYARNV